MSIPVRIRFFAAACACALVVIGAAGTRSTGAVHVRKAAPATTTTTSTATPTTPTTLPPTTTTLPPPPPDTTPPPPPEPEPEPAPRYVAPPPPEPEPEPPAPVSSADPQQAARSTALVNSWRKQNGLGALAITGDAQSKAQAHAEAMAAAGKIWHTNLTAGLSGWSSWAENVAAAGDADQIHQMLQASSGHNANMLSPSATHIGVGAAWGIDGNLYICQIFVG